LDLEEIVNTNDGILDVTPNVTKEKFGKVKHNVIQGAIFRPLSSPNMQGKEKSLTFSHQSPHLQALLIMQMKN